MNVSSGAKNLVTVGRIKTVYGVKGWLKIESFTQPLQNILDYDNWVIETSTHQILLQYDDAKVRGNDIVVHFEGLDDREKAREYTQALVKVASNELPELSADDFYWRQLEGLTVYQMTEHNIASQVTSEQEYDWLEQNCLGIVDHMLETGANDVMVIRPRHESVKQAREIESDPSNQNNLVKGKKAKKTKELLIPYLLDTVVKKVDLERGAILVDWYNEPDA